MLYSYSCNKCNTVFDEFNSYENRDNAQCPYCKDKDVSKLISMPEGAMVDSTYRDAMGEKIWFPKDGKPYFDPALRVTFNNIKEKHEYMKKNRVIMSGSASPLKYPIESGDARSKSWRRMKRMED